MSRARREKRLSRRLKSLTFTIRHPLHYLGEENGIPKMMHIRTYKPSLEYRQ